MNKTYLVRSNKNIALLLGKFSSGGTERVASNISLFLNEKYKQFIVLYINDGIDYPHRGEIIDLGLVSRNNLFSKLYNFFLRIKKIKHLKRKLSIECSISFAENANLVNIISGGNDKKIITIHFHKSAQIKNIYGRIYDFIIKYFYNKADFIVAVCETMRHDLINNYGLQKEKVITIHNFYDINLIKKQAQEKIPEEYNEIFTKPVIINVGRLTYQKGQWHLIKAFKYAKEKVTDLQLVLMGGKEGMYDKLIQMVHEMGLNHSIHFLPFQKNPYCFMNKSKIFALTSLWEGFPNVLVESLASECPVISVDCKSGPRELLNPKGNLCGVCNDVEFSEYGILSPPMKKNINLDKNQFDDEEKLFAEAILRIFGNQDIYEKYKMVSSIRANDFNAEMNIKKYEKLL